MLLECVFLISCSKRPTLSPATVFQSPSPGNIILYVHFLFFIWIDSHIYTFSFQVNNKFLSTFTPFTTNPRIDRKVDAGKVSTCRTVMLIIPHVDCNLGVLFK